MSKRVPTSKRSRVKWMLKTLKQLLPQHSIFVRRKPGTMLYSTNPNWPTEFNERWIIHIGKRGWSRTRAHAEGNVIEGITSEYAMNGAIDMIIENKIGFQD